MNGSHIHDLNGLKLDSSIYFGPLIAFIGVLMVGLVVSLIIYFVFKEKASLFYSLHLLTFVLLFTLVLEASGYHDIFFNFFPRIKSVFFSILGPLATVIYAAFIRSFLEEKPKIVFEWTFRVLVSVSIVIIAMVVLLSLRKPEWVNHISVVLLERVVTACLALYSLSLLFAAQLRYKWYLRFGSSVLLLMVFIIILYNYHFIHIASVTRADFNVLAIATATSVESLILSAALVSSIRRGIEQKQQLHNLLKEEIEHSLHIERERNEYLSSTLQKHVKDVNEQLQIISDQADKLVFEDFKRNVLSLEFEIFKAHLNPHFLFNVLNSLKLYLLTKPKEECVALLSLFSKWMRITLKNGDKDNHSLSSELEAIKLYIDLENIRLREKISLEVKIDSISLWEESTFRFLLLQPLVERIIWQNLLPKHGKKEISIHAYKQDDSFIITLKDNGVTDVGDNDGHESNHRLLSRMDRLFAMQEKFGQIQRNQIVDSEGNTLGNTITLTFQNEA